MDGEISRVWKRGFLEERKVELGWGEGRFGGETAFAQAQGDKRMSVARPEDGCIEAFAPPNCGQGQPSPVGLWT